jgi:5-hydroxyisourate hydrolase-like protein (transthyretin family)
MISSAIRYVALLVSLLPQHAKPATAQQSFRISGVVVDALNGQPLPSTQIFLFTGSIEPTEIMASELTDADGKFAFEDVPPGKYTLNAQRRGYAPQAYLQHENYWTGIAVGPGLDAERIRFPLQPSASISGQVLDEGSEPVRAASVLLFEQGLENGRRTTRMRETAATDDQGHFRFGHLLPGNYIVGISAVPWYSMAVPQSEEADGEEPLSARTDSNWVSETALDVIYPATFFPNARDISSATVIRVHPGDVEKADMRLQPVAALHLRVRVPTGDAANNSNIQIMQQLGEGLEVPVRTAQRSLEPGMIELTGLPPGRMVVHADSSEGGSRNTQTQSVDLSGNSEIEASRGSADLKVTGTAKMEGGSGLPQMAVIQLRMLPSGEANYARCQPTGEFSFESDPITAGMHEVSFPNADLFIKNLKATGAKVSGLRVEFEAGEDVKLELTLAKGMSSISGIALRDGKPTEGAMVLLVPRDMENNAQLIRRDQSDSDGTFTLKMVPPGHYTVVAIEKGWELEWANAEVLRKYLPGGENVQVGSDAAPSIKVKVQ